VVTAVVAAAALVWVAGCGTPAPSPAGPAPAASSAPSTPAAATPTAPATRAGALLWPVTDASQVAALQQQVDTGSQPWLLDPSEVAVNYAVTVYGWQSPQAGAADGGTVQVTDAQGGRATVTLVQPGRSGPQGIWIVSAERRN
jgi:hypothetical protein